VKYYKPGYGEFAKDAVHFQTQWGSTGAGHGAAEDAAAHYHELSGWEATWPIQFALVDDDGTLLGVFNVYREAVPSFCAIKIHDESEVQGG